MRFGVSLRSRDDPSGCLVVGMLGNCAGGVTPWGTILTAEENFDHYFAVKDRLRADDPVARAHAAYLTTFKDHAWERHHRRFDVSEVAHEPFRFGWIVEIHPYDPAQAPKKRTALGRFKHEGAGTVLSGDGRPVVYSGDDEPLQYVYKFVGSRPAGAPGLPANRDLLDDGTLYAARFEVDGSGSWLPLTSGWTPSSPTPLRRRPTCSSGLARRPRLCGPHAWTGPRTSRCTPSRDASICP